MSIFSLEASEQLVRAQVYSDVILLRELCDYEEDLNDSREVMMELLDRLEYLLIDEG